MTSSRTDAVARFATAWQRCLQGDRLPPRISDYVPDATQVRLAVLTDLVRVDLRRRWEREGLGKRVAEYRKEFPEVGDSPELVELVCEEFLARRRRAPLPLPDFLAEYPDLAGEVRERLADFAADDAAEVATAESSAAAAVLADLSPGLRIEDFDLLTDLGGSLLGRVFLARQRSMQRLVAVRFSAGRAGAPQTMAQLDHAHIVRVFDQRVLGPDIARTMTVSAAPGNPAIAVSDTGAAIAEPRPDLDTTVAAPFDPGATIAAPHATSEAIAPDDHAQDATVAAPHATDGVTTVSAPPPDLDTTVAAPFDPDATIAGRPTGREATNPDDNARDTTVAAPHGPDRDTTVSAPPPDLDTTVAAPFDPDATIAGRPTGREATNPDDNARDTTVAAPHGRDGDTTIAEPHGLDTTPAQTPDPDAAAGTSRRASPPRRNGAERSDETSTDSAEGTAVLTHPDATPVDRSTESSTLVRPPARTGATSAAPRDATLPSAPAAALPRLVYMQYLPGGTAVGVLEQGRRGPVADGGALLLRAVDSAMEAKSEIRPSDSSVRAEIARLSWPETVAWVGRRLADALDYAANHGVLHHDIKPANVLFTAEGIPKLADFALGESGPRTNGVSQAAAATDSLAYRSPEQLARYLDPDAPAPGDSSDVYSLGVLLWEMLTGASPFDDPPLAESGPTAETYAGMLALRRRGVAAVALSRVPEGTPAALRRVLLECLHVDPKHRWRSGAELAVQLDLCLDARARDLVDPPPDSFAYRARGWLLPIAAVCIGVPNVLASFYNIQLNQTLIIDRMSPAAQEKFAAVGLINNLIAFPVAALLLLFLTRRPLALAYRLRRGRAYSASTLAKARRDTLLMGDWAVWVPFGFWLVAGIIWPLGLAFSGVDLPPKTFLHFFAAQVVCAAIALAYPFFPIMVYSLRSVYPQLLVRGGIGPGDERQLRSLAKRGNFYLGVAASVPLLGVASATFVDPADLGLVIVPVRVLSVGGILAFVLTYRLFRLLESDLLAVAEAIPQRTR
ncbi:protein kinase [Nocardia amamiensis]|uniref:Protein kinase n=1 Tax=Nocardia amamiensis TaxID=404578 RepID=A0ABS0CV16_9NOCA|nr:protein kinase [Nocardia amamiensis]MBF6299688.1 protein kinase [Nocardia amamiensis]